LNIWSLPAVVVAQAPFNKPRTLVVVVVPVGI
jgi:hypothetical protein